MSVIKIIDDYLLEFGNERFLEGWNGQEERTIKLLEDKYNYLIDIYGIAIVKDQLDLLLELIELIKGETK